MFRLSFFLMAVMLIAGSVFAQAWTFGDVSSMLSPQPEYAAVVTFGDLNGDGHPDLFVGGDFGIASHIYLYDRAFYVERSGAFNFHLNATVTKAQFLDYNHDGLMDLFLLTDDDIGVRIYKQGVDHRLTLIRPTGEMTFDNRVRDAVWNDMDADGNLDLMLSNGPSDMSPMTVYAQVSDAEFAEMRDNPWESLTNVGAMTLADYDHDGRPDYFLGWGGDPSQARFYRNVNGEIQDFTERFEIPSKAGSRGMVWLDYDNDGRLDMFCTGDAENTALFHGEYWKSTDAIKRVTAPDMIDEAVNGYEVHTMDVNVDGWPDLFITRALGEGNALLLNQQGAGWMQVARQVHLDNTNHMNLSCTWADFDRDNDPDMAVAQGPFGVRIYRNGLPDPHQCMTVNLLNREGTPLYNCNAQINWEVCKQIGSTFPSSTANSGDGSGLLFVNRTTDKGTWVILTVKWPNGVTRRYDLDQLRTDTINDLMEPSLTNDPEEAPDGASQTMHSVEGGGPVTISPNPFNPTTTIGFSLPEAAAVELTVYNIAGREVARLAHGGFAAGEHRVTFDASALPSGLYFSRLTVGNRTTMARMLLMK